MSKVKPIPDGVPVVMPMLVCRDAAAAIDFCKATFGAVELVRRPGPDGSVAHAALTFGGAMIMIEGEWPTLASRPSQRDGSSPVEISGGVQRKDAKTLRRKVEKTRPEPDWRAACAHQKARRKTNNQVLQNPCDFAALR